MAFIIKIVLVIGLILGIYGYINYNSSKQNKNLYCQMVSIWEKDKGKPPKDRNGWPPFDQTIKCDT